MANQSELVCEGGDIEVEETKDDDEEKKGKKKSLTKMMRVTICELEAALKVPHTLYAYHYVCAVTISGITRVAC